MTGRAIALAFGLLAGLTAAPAMAQVSVSVPTGAPNLGKVVATSGSSTFSVALDGTVTRTSGSAVRLNNSAVTAPTVNLTCGLLNLAGLCAIRKVRVTLQPVASGGPATITNLRVGSISGASLFSAAPVPGPTVSFDLWPMGLLTSVSFKVAMDVVVTPGATTGDVTFPYTVTADFLP